MNRDFQVSVETEGEKVILRFDAGFRDVLAELIRPLVVFEPSLSPAFSRNVEEMPLRERDFVVSKQPRGHHQLVAVLAFWLREAGVSEFDSDEMRKVYIRANQRPPKVMAQALRDAKNKYQLLEAGSKPNYFRLSPHGERTVLFDLPEPKTK